MNLSTDGVLDVQSYLDEIKLARLECEWADNSLRIPESPKNSRCRDNWTVSEYIDVRIVPAREKRKVTDDKKRQIRFEAAMMGETLRDAYRLTEDSQYAYLLGRLDQAIKTAEARENGHESQ